MKALVIALLFLTTALFSIAQKTGEFSVEFGFQQRMFNMKQLNSFLQTPYSYSPNFYLTPPNYRIENGTGFDLAIMYQPNKLFDVGVYGGFQSGKILNDVNYYLIDDVNSDTVVYNGMYKMNVSAFTGGTVFNYYLSNQFNFSEKEGFLKSFLLSIEAKVGFGYTYLRDVYFFDDDPFGYEQSVFGHSAWSGHGELAIKAGYRFTETPLITGLNLKLGYQYLASSDLRNNNGHGLSIYTADANLEFSGLFAGISLSVGK